MGGAGSADEVLGLREPRSRARIAAAMDTAPKNLRPGLTGGRVDHAGAFPDEQEQYRHLTPSERIVLLRELNRRLFAIAEGKHGRRGHQGLPDRLVGGRR